APAELGEVIEDAATDDSAADHRDLRMALHDVPLMSCRIVERQTLFRLFSNQNPTTLSVETDASHRTPDSSDSSNGRRVTMETQRHRKETFGIEILRVSVVPKPGGLKPLWPSHQKSVGAPPSSFRLATKASSSSRMASSSGGGSYSRRSRRTISAARSGATGEPASRQVPKFRQSGIMGV